MQLNNTTNISDDQELAQALAGVNSESMPFEETTPAPTPAKEDKPEKPADKPAKEEKPAEAPATEPTLSPFMSTTSAADTAPIPGGSSLPNRDGLDNVKIEAINELRPLIDKLTLPAEEKFDTYLLLIRTTDDQELVAPAHEVAKQIEDESRRAMALLDIIKEIDYLSNKSGGANAK